jgi:tRNA A-37 threonylcarbamoyl transferase component Bud32
MPTCALCQTIYAEGVAVCARDGALLARPAASEGAPAMVAPGASAAVGDGGGAVPGGGSGAEAAAGAVVAALAAAPEPAPEADAREVFDSMIGATLAGRYRIVRRIGEGGMGAVYEAVHTIIGKRLAVKVLLEKFLTKTDFVARLLQEARLASAIGHEHIVDVTDFGTTDDGRAFVAMEFLDGESLAELVMREAPLPVERSLRIVRQVASALGAAHAKGIVHRDIKPENVYLVRRGDEDFVKVVDFGISKAVKQGQGLGDEGTDYRLTHTGLLLGTPLYMSPEQARGEEDLDQRVDIWALGVMLYECLTGEVPFRANNYLGIISQVLTHDARPPSQLRPELGIPEAVESVVMHAMEKDRSRRYATMAEVERDLERLLAGDQNVGSPVAFIAAPRSGSTPPPPSRAGTARPWVWGAAALALVAGVIAVLRHPRDPEAGATPEAARAELLPAPGPTTHARGEARSAPSAPDFSGRPSGTATAPTQATDSTDSRRSPTGPESADNRARRARVNRVTPLTPAAPAAPRPTPPARTLVRGSVPLRPARAARTEDPAAGTRDSTGSEAALRGALPSRSGEGYPEN